VSPAAPLVPDTVVRHRPGVLFRDLAGEAVLLDPQAGIYFGLNEAGTHAWNLMGSGTSLGAVHAVLAAAYDAPPEQIWDDLVALAGDLLAHRLAEVP